MGLPDVTEEGGWEAVGFPSVTCTVPLLAAMTVCGSCKHQITLAVPGMRGGCRQDQEL